MEGTRYKSQEIDLAPGDSLFLYTDGVTEALDPDQNLYSDPRLLAFFQETDLTGKSLEEQLSLLAKDIITFAAGAEQADDVTMLLLRLNPNQSSADQA